MTNDKVTNVAVGGSVGGFKALKQKSHNPGNTAKDGALKNACLLNVCMSKMGGLHTNNAQMRCSGG